MTEHDRHSAEFIAHATIADYIGVGPEPNFGELAVEDLDEWIRGAEGSMNNLTPTEVINVGWMHVERAWSRLTESGFLGEEPPAEITAAILDDLAVAKALFSDARFKANLSLRAHIDVAKTSLSLLGPILTTPYTVVSTTKTAQYLASQHSGNLLCLEEFKRAGCQPNHVPPLDTSLGLRLLTGHFLATTYAPLIASYRHAYSGSPASRWHIALHNRSDSATYKVRIAPHGPPTMILLPPAMFGHAGITTKHSRGMLEAIVDSDLWRAVQRRRIEAGQEPLVTDKIVEYQTRIRELDERLGPHLVSELQRVSRPQPEYLPPEDPVAWYESLSPFADPCHESFGGALEVAISQCEIRKLTEDNTQGMDYQLGWMYMESGASLRAMDTSIVATLVGSFERAEDLFASSRDAIPTAERQTSRYFELAIAEITAPMYRALITCENVAEHIDIYRGQLCVLAPQMLEAYNQQSDKTSANAEALNHLLHLVTACLTAMHADNNLVLLPGSPRQRGSYGETRGWDFAVWVFDSEGTYVPGQFNGRLEDKDDPFSVDNVVITITKKQLSAVNFRLLRSILTILDPPSTPHPKPDFKVARRVHSELSQLFYSANQPIPVV